MNRFRRRIAIVSAWTCAWACAALPAAAAEAPAARGPATTSAAPAVAAPRIAAGAGGPAAIRGDNVLIEGKLYSPQALFIVTRRAESFGRDAIVPKYLEVRPDATFLPYRLRADRLGTASAADSSAAGTAR
jgi:hypothetical protein